MNKNLIEQVSPNSNVVLELTIKLHADLETTSPKNTQEAFIRESKLIDIFIVAFSESGKPVASGALKFYSPGVIEVKRIFVIKEFRGQGISKQILRELERIAKELNYKRIILETGVKQLEAISLYKKYGYNNTECYGRYENDPTSVCFEKIIG